MTVNAIQNLNLQTQSDSDANATQVMNLKPTTVSLGTVIGSTTSSGTTTYYAGEIDFLMATASNSVVEFNALTTAAYNALSALSSGDTLTLGPWASNNGNPTSVTVSSTNGDTSSFYVNWSSAANNYSQFGPPRQAQSPSHYVSISFTSTVVTTDNSSLALSQTYFEIGNLTPFVSANATVSGSTVTLNGDFGSSISAGMSVVEKNYAAGPSVQQYNLVTGAWVDYAQSSVWGSPTTLTATHRGTAGLGIFSTNDYMWGITHIEIPSDWNDWVIDVNATCSISMANATGSTIAYAQLRMITNPTSVGGDKLTINGTSRHAQRSASIQVYNSSYVPGTARELTNEHFLSPTLNQRHFLGLHTVINKPVVDTWETFESTTEVCVYAWLDPRFQQGNLNFPTMQVTARRVG